jgi:DNA-binding transcriptional LysR family regulator
MDPDVEAINLSDLRTFMAVARALSVTGAARSLGVPKSAVSKSLTRLEGALEVRLLERSSRRVALTPAGVLLVPRAEALLGEAEALAQCLRDEQREPHGLVRVTATPDSGAWFVERVVPAILREHSGIRIAVTMGYDIDDLLDPTIDVGLRVGKVIDERLVAHRIARFRHVVVASPAYLAAHPVRRVADLASRSCLVFSAAETEATWAFTQPDLAEEVKVTAQLSARSFTALLHAARAGLGVTRVPEPLADEWLRRGDVVRILPEWASGEVPLLVVHRVGHERIARVAAVVRAARAHAWFVR